MDGSTVQVTKRCRKCGEEKPATREWFYRDAATRDGWRPWCKACSRLWVSRTRKTPVLTPELFAARFWAKVNKNGPVPLHVPELGQCWEWTAYRGKFGYGEVGRSRPRRVELAHRVAWEFANGPAGEMCVLHKCDHPPCVRASHLFLGTRTENMADKIRKGRQTRGAAQGRAVLNEETVIRARQMRASGIKTGAISRALGIKYTTLRAVLSRQSWRHLP
jgi:hypothetical protein